MKHIVTGVLVVASVMACGKKTTDASTLSSNQIKPSEIKLYDEPNATPDVGCDIHTLLSLKNTAKGPVASLENRVDGFCEIAISPSKREYLLEVSTNSCGTKTYSGYKDEVNSIEIADYRESSCENVILAPVEVIEIYEDHRLKFFSLPAAAKKPRKFICGNVGGTEEHVIMIDLEKNKAGFFDNDNTAVVPHLRTVILESLPPQTEYTFEGPDSGGATGERMSIVFNETTLEASVTFNGLRTNPQTLKSLDGCSASDDFDLDR